MFYQDFNSKIEKAKNKRKFFKKTSQILKVTAYTALVSSLTAAISSTGIAMITLSYIPSLIVGSIGAVSSIALYGLAYASNKFADQVGYEVRYYNEKKILQDLFKENENTLQKRYQRRRHIAFLKEEFKKTKLIGNESMEETLQKSNKAKDIAIEISKNSEILRTGCASRSQKAQKLLKIRKSFWNSYHRE